MASVISAGLTTTTALVYTADTSGVLQLQTNGSTTAVTIDTSQRVGIGTTSPQNAFVVSNAGAAGIEFVPSYTGLATGPAIYSYNRSGSTWTPQVYLATSHYWGFGSNPSTDGVGMLLDTSGNLGLGVTPSAWGAYKALQIGSYGGSVLNFQGGGGNTSLNHNLTTSDNGITWKYLIGGAYGGRYVIDGLGVHSWYTTQSTQGAGNTALPTQVMTLANGGGLGLTGPSSTATSGSILGISSTASPYPRQLAFGIDETNGWTFQENILQGSGVTPHRFYSYSTYAGSYNGSAWYQGNNSTTWSTTSDQRLKKNIVTNTEGLEKINNIRICNFEYRLPSEVDPSLNANYAVEITGVQLGVIAQELQTVLPDSVKEDNTGVLSVNADNILWHLVTAVQQLSAKVTALEAKVA